MGTSVNADQSDRRYTRVVIYHEPAEQARGPTPSYLTTLYSYCIMGKPVLNHNTSCSVYTIGLHDELRFNPNP